MITRPSLNFLSVSLEYFRYLTMPSKGLKEISGQKKKKKKIARMSTMHVCGAVSGQPILLFVVCH